MTRDMRRNNTKKDGRHKRHETKKDKVRQSYES